MKQRSVRLRGAFLPLAVGLVLAVSGACTSSNEPTASLADPNDGAGGAGADSSDDESPGGATSGATPAAAVPTAAAPTVAATAPSPSAPPAPQLSDDAGVPGERPPAVPPAPEPTVAPPVMSAPPAVPDAGPPAPVASIPDASPPAEEEEGWMLDLFDDPLENPAECPVEEPTEGGDCPTYELICKYGGEPNCRSRWHCLDGNTWYMEVAKRDCPEVCPAEEPTEGAPCSTQNAQCTFGPDPTCRSQWMCFESQWTLIFPARECAENNCPETPPRIGVDCDPELYQNGCIYESAYNCGCSCVWDEAAIAAQVPTTRWFCDVIETGYPPSYLTACPSEVPVAGTPCDTNSTCGYVTLDECIAPGAGMTLANCTNGAWSIEGPTPIAP